MDKLTKYKSIIKHLLNQYAQFKPINTPEVETQIVIDEKRNHFLLMEIGWHKKKFIHDCVFHIDLKEEKVWVQQDWTDADIAGELIRSGIAKSDVILGFQPPHIQALKNQVIA